MKFNLNLAKLAGLFAISFGLTVALLNILNLGCGNRICTTDAYHYGLRLFFAFIFLATIGWICLSNQTQNHQPPEFPLYSSIALGMMVSMVYIYARSLFNHVVTDIPISRLEVFGLIAVFFARIKWRNKHGSPSRSAMTIDGNTFAISLAILLAICIAVADRELPRLMLMSSDPDQHAFFGKQIQRFGAVPYQQREWGPQGFNYPAGSGVVLYITHLLGGLDPRNSLVVLPTLFTFFAALMAAEVFSIKEARFRLILRLSALALAGGGLMFPLYSEYIHGEGSARLMSILFVGFLTVALAKHVTTKESPSTSFLAASSLALFAMMVLNPANAMMPAVLLTGLVAYGLLNGKKRAYLLMLPLLAGTVLTLLDPYYQKMAGFGNSQAGASLILNERFSLLSPSDVAAAAVHFYIDNSKQFFENMSVLLVESRSALFFLLMTIYGACLLAVSNKPKFTLKAGIAAAVFFITLYLVYGFAFAFDKDSRFYLLGPYLFFNISQYKAMLLVFMVTLIIKKSIDASMPTFATILLSALLAWPAVVLIRESQEMYMYPRRHYCGSMGCFDNEDKALLKDFKEMTRSGKFKDENGVSPKVLIPNALSTSNIEGWIFPVGSARVLPHYDVLPAAFYYFQGDSEYGTASYDQHVCQVFDRAWMLAKGINYVYLPTNREKACIAGMEELIQSEEIVLNEGRAYLLKLRK